MAKKRGLPIWLSLVLVMVLVVLVLVVISSKSEQGSSQQPAAALSHGKAVASVVTKPVVSKPAVSTSLSSNQTPSKPNQNPTPPTSNQASSPAIPAREMPAPVLPPKPALPQAHGLSLILDDVGYSIVELKRILALSVPVAISVLPDSPYARKSAELAHQAGQIVMLHLPMQPIDPSLVMSSAFLIEGMSKTALHDTFLQDLDQVPYVEGVNNHMGSRLTQLEKPMRQVMKICQQKGLFFVDSRTTADSVAAQVAQRTGIQWATRQFFLDHVMTDDYMQQTWNRARACVKKGHRCIIIAHPRPASVAFLASHLSKADAAAMVTIKHLLRTNQP